MREEGEMTEWQRCPIGSCARHQRCMYTPCRAHRNTKAQSQANDFDAALYRLIYRASALAGPRKSKEDELWGAVHEALQRARPHVRQLMSAHDREDTR
jgi:hypothetical protein